MTVTDKIGEDYKNWRDEEKIFITGPTGSGKTFFVLNSLLPYAKQQNKRILYLVNRSILKAQIEEDILRCPYQYHNSISVELYQTIENQMSRLRYDSGPEYGHATGYENLGYLKKYDYIVCDDESVIIGTNQKKPSKIKGLQMI